MKWLQSFIMFINMIALAMCFLMFFVWYSTEMQVNNPYDACYAKGGETIYQGRCASIIYKD